MLGSAILNTQILNGIGEVLPFTPLNPGEVSLGGVNLTTFGIRANLRDLDNAAQRIIKTQEVPRGDGLTIIDDYFGEIGIPEGDSFETGRETLRNWLETLSLISGPMQFPIYPLDIIIKDPKGFMLRAGFREYMKMEQELGND